MLPTYMYKSTAELMNPRSNTNPCWMYRSTCFGPLPTFKAAPHSRPRVSRFPPQEEEEEEELDLDAIEAEVQQLPSPDSSPVASPPARRLSPKQVIMLVVITSVVVTVWCLVWRITYTNQDLLLCSFTFSTARIRMFFR
jgi:hypothetical protein